MTAFIGHSAPVRVGFSSEGKLLATASEDETARVWEVASGDELCSFVHGGQVFGVTFSTDDTKLLTASGDEVARAWALSPSPWLTWGCAMLNSRGAHTSTTRRTCASASMHEVAIAGAMGEPSIIDGDGPNYEVIVEHGVEYVLIPGGTFMMGSPEGGNEDEHPQHEVRLDGFYLARTELTNAQYTLYLKANPGVEKASHWCPSARPHPDEKKPPS